METTKAFKFRRRTTVRGIARELLRLFEDKGRFGRYSQDSHCYCVLEGLSAVCGYAPADWAVMGMRPKPARFVQAFAEALPRPYRSAEGADTVAACYEYNDKVGLAGVRRVLRKLAA